MRKNILISLIMVMVSYSLAQQLRGGFGHAFVGTAFNVSPGIQNDLGSSSLLGNDLQLNHFARVAGGGGYGLIGGKVLLGGSGYGYQVADATNRGQATLSVGGGFVNVGYLIVQRDNLLAFPYFGMGGNGMRLKIKNGTSDNVFDLGNKTINPGRYLNLNSAGLSFEIGYSMQFLTFSLAEDGGHGGLMIGLQAGAYIFSGLEDWHEQNSDDLVASLSATSAFSPYVRLTIGGGGFSVRAK